MAKARGASGKAPLGGWPREEEGHRRAEAVTEAPASSRCPLRGLSSQALGCRRSSFFLWLGHLLSSSLWKACVRAACLPGRPRPQLGPGHSPVHNWGAWSQFRCTSSQELRRMQDPLASGTANTCVPKSWKAPSSSRRTPLSRVCWESRIYRIREVMRRREGGKPWPGSSSVAQDSGDTQFPSAWALSIPPSLVCGGHSVNLVAWIR